MNQDGDWFSHDPSQASRPIQLPSPSDSPPLAPGLCVLHANVVLTSLRSLTSSTDTCCLQHSELGPFPRANTFRGRAMGP